MKIRIRIGETVAIFHDDRRIGTVDYETFCLKVLSPRQFSSLERNPDLCDFDVRRLDLDQALAGWTISSAYLQPFEASHSPLPAS